MLHSLSKVNLKEDELDLIIVPDVHLLTSLLGHVDFLAKKYGVKRLLFVGDYFNRYTKTESLTVYKATVDFLNYLNESYDCIFLVGNHDVSYIYDEQYKPNYHTSVREGQIACHSFFTDLLREGKLKGYHKEHGIIFSHAGFKEGHPEISAYRDLTEPTLKNKDLYFQATKDHKSPILGRPTEWADYLSDPVPQVFGHTPLPYIHEFGSSKNLVGIDTWSDDFYLSATMTTSELIEKRRAKIKEGDWSKLKRGDCSLVGVTKSGKLIKLK